MTNEEFLTVFLPGEGWELSSAGYYQNNRTHQRLMTSSYRQRDGATTCQVMRFGPVQTATATRTGATLYEAYQKLSMRFSVRIIFDSAKPKPLALTVNGQQTRGECLSDALLNLAGRVDPDVLKQIDEMCE